MKHSRLLSAFLAFLITLTVSAQMQFNLHRVSGYAGVSPIPQQMKQGYVAFKMPIPKRVKIKKGLVGKSAVRYYAQKVPYEKESYYLKISKKEIVLVGRDEAGLFYGEQTLNQILSKGGNILETEIVDWPSVDCRGAIEGFYGNPWSHKDRIRQFEFYGQNKMNMYVYGPKDDPYHRRHWREPYPKKEAELLKELAKEAKKNHVQFVWAVHPGIDIQWNLSDSLAIVKKLESVYKLGVRSFAVFFDDISGEGTKADKQAGLMNYITKKFVKKHKDVEPLILCPTQYNMAWSHGDYLKTLGKKMYSDIRIMWTGNSVVDMIDKEDMEWINEQIGRKAFIWLNYPVNDYCQSRILMGKTYGNSKEIAPMLSGFCSNPMEYAEASKVSLYSIADYTWNMRAYDAQSSWERAIEKLMPTSREAFKVFCENNVDLGVTGHGLRREGESIKFKRYLDALKKLAPTMERYEERYLKDMPKSNASDYDYRHSQIANRGYEATQNLCKEIDIKQLKLDFSELLWASHALLTDSVNQPEMLGEIAPWVHAMYYAAARGISLTEEAQALLDKESYKFVYLFNNYRTYEEAQKKIRSRDFEGSIVKAQPAFSGDVVTPLLTELNSALITLYKMQYREHWDIFPHGVLPEGDYYIMYAGKLLTDSLASPTQTGDFPVFQTDLDVINPQRQLWHFEYNEKTETFNITNVQDGRYLNEIGNFWRNMEQNPFDPTYHSFMIEKKEDKYSIRQTGRGGSSYWLSNGHRITTGNASDNCVFQIVKKEDMHN